jgi:hypothetical protein
MFGLCVGWNTNIQGDSLHVGLPRGRDFLLVRIVNFVTIIKTMLPEVVTVLFFYRLLIFELLIFERVSISW